MQKVKAHVRNNKKVKAHMRGKTPKSKVQTISIGLNVAAQAKVKKLKFSKRPLTSGGDYRGIKGKFKI